MKISILRLTIGVDGHRPPRVPRQIESVSYQPPSLSALYWFIHRSPQYTGERNCEWHYIKLRFCEHAKLELCGTLETPRQIILSGVYVPSG